MRSNTLASLLLVLSLVGAVAGQDVDQRSFANKLIFTETPDVGVKWRGGIRMDDFFVWDLYWNLGGVMTVDYFDAGFRNLHPGDITISQDRMTLFALKSLPVKATLLRSPYKIAGGLKAYGAVAKAVDGWGSAVYDKEDRALSLFVTQSLFVKNTHYLNLYTSYSTRTLHLSDGTARNVGTYYIVPGYRGYFGRTHNWSFALEYFMMNPMELPFKIVQFALDKDNMEFSNPDQRMISYMFWGFTYARRHLRLDLYLANHISFAIIPLPMIGVGWNF